jgi:hypothetical protein
MGIFPNFWQVNFKGESMLRGNFANFRAFRQFGTASA